MKKLKLAVVSEEYPNPDNLYGDVFAHARVKEYLAAGHTVRVFASLTQSRTYFYEGVEVVCPGSVDRLTPLLQEWNADVVLIHFATHPIIRKVIFAYDVPYLVWVHGYEALAWYRRLFNFRWYNVRALLRYIASSSYQLYHYRRLIHLSNQGRRIEFVFVSEWMRRITQTDCLVRVLKSHVIPNPIDTRLFCYREKPADLRTRVLLIRPFHSKKYATDVVTDAMIEMERIGLFEKFQFSIFGKGCSKSEMFQLFAERANVTFHEGFLTQQQVKEQHDTHGVFMALTRQDSQGVSMCEAMSSGLVPISTNNTAIPEFVTDGVSGLLATNCARSVTDALRRLLEEPELFAKLSAGASREIECIAGVNRVMPLELELIDSMDIS